MRRARAETAVQCRTGECEDKKNDDQCTEQEQQPLPDRDLPHPILLEFFQKGKGAELYGPQFPFVP